MTEPKLKRDDPDTLLRRYVEIGIAQDEAVQVDDNRRFNRLFGQLMEIERQLRALEGDQRRRLMNFYDHPNWQVRLNSAKATLAVAPSEARRLLQFIRSSNHFPQAGDAGMCLRNLDRGIFKPD